MAEWLGTGLQNLLQRFDSAWYLQKCLWTLVRGLFFVILSRPSTREGVFVHGVGKIKGPCTVEPVSVLGLVKNGPAAGTPSLRPFIISVYLLFLYTVKIGYHEEDLVTSL